LTGNPVGSKIAAEDNMETGYRRSRSLEERFFEKIDKRRKDECWIWKASFQKGYGQIGIKGQAFPEKAHRASWIIHFGKIPDGLFVLHKCDNPACVNPRHLFLGTQLDNIRDMDKKGRRVSSGPTNRVGELSNSAKLSDDLVRYIRQERNKGRSQQSVADEIGVDRKTISCVDTGKTWSHVK